MEWFNNVKIKNKLFIVFGIMLCVAIFFAIFAVVGIIDVGQNLEELISSYQMRQIHLAEAITDVYKIRLVNLSKGYLLEDELKGIVSELHINLDENIELFVENLSAYRSIVISDPRLTADERQSRLDSVNEIMALFAIYEEITRGLNFAVKNNDKQQMIRVVEESINVGNELSRKVMQLRDRIFTTVSQKAAETQAVAIHTINIIAGVSVVFILFSVLAMLFTVHNINQPIKKLEKAMVEIAKGNMTFPIRSGRKDELGSLANSIGDMIDELEVLNAKKQREELLHEALNAAKIASAAKSSFLANMSHEIRTPMNAVLGITEILLQDATLAPDIREALSKIYNSGDLLLSIINDILDLSKIEAGKLDLTPNKYEVASLINDTVTLNMMRVGSKPIEFVLSVDENIPSSLIGDELRIKQVLNNLLSNAFKYTEKGIVKLTVALSEKDAGDAPDPLRSGTDEATGLVFIVSDTGQGMSGEQLAKLFDEYSRFNMEANRTTEGTGLGMSIVQNLVGLMSGEMSVKSEVGWGTVFTVRLPQVSVGSGVLGKELVESLQNFRISDIKQSRKTQIVYEPMPYGKVLIVDDAETNLYVARGLMAPYELTIETAESGFRAIDLVKDGNIYDIVFMDHMMPVMDGIEATGILRSIGYTHPIVALTANAVAGQEEVFLENGFDGFISKPIDMRQLNAVLKKFVRIKQRPQADKTTQRQTTAVIDEKAGSPPDPQISPKLAECFVQDVTKASSVLEGMVGKQGVYADEDIRLYTITVHAIKSALANVGESEFSSIAAKLEQAGRNNDTAIIKSETPAFLNRLRAVALKLAPPA